MNYWYVSGVAYISKFNFPQIAGAIIKSAPIPKKKPKKLQAQSKVANYGFGSSKLLQKGFKKTPTGIKDTTRTIINFKMNFPDSLEYINILYKFFILFLFTKKASKIANDPLIIAES